MNIYLTTNNFNKQNNINPVFYIGSDTKDKKDYFGSSKLLKNDIKNIGKEYFSKEILWQGDYNDLYKLGYNKLVALENKIQKEYNVVKSNKFYNLCYANKEFASNGFANYFYLNDPNQKIISLPINHPDVINGLVVGMNKNKIVSEITKQKLKEKRKLRIFSEEDKQKLRKPKNNKQNYKKPKSEKHKESQRHPKSEETKQKMSNNSVNKKIVIQYSLLNEILNIFSSGTEAAKTIGKNYKTIRTAISDCCKGKIKTAYGFKWNFQENHLTS